MIWIIDSPLLIKVVNHKFAPIGNLPPGFMPLFPTSFAIEVPVPEPLASLIGKDIRMRWRQVPYCAAFAITDYKSQGRTFSNVILDLESPNPKGGVRGGHYTYTAVYVVLSRCCSRSGLSFLRAFPYATFFAKPDPGLGQEERRLQALEIQTSGINYEALLAAY